MRITGGKKKVLATFVADITKAIKDIDTGADFPVEPDTMMRLVKEIHKAWNETIGLRLGAASGYEDIAALGRRAGSGLMEARSAENLSNADIGVREAAFSRMAEDIVKKAFPSRYFSQQTDDNGMPIPGKYDYGNETGASMLDLSNVIRYLNVAQNGQTYSPAPMIRNQRAEVVELDKSELSETSFNRIRRKGKGGASLAEKTDTGYRFETPYGMRVKDDMGHTQRSVSYIRNLVLEAVQNEADEAQRVRNEEDALLIQYSKYTPQQIAQFTDAERKKKLSEARKIRGYNIRANTPLDNLKEQSKAKIRESKTKTAANSLAFQEEYDSIRGLLEAAELQQLQSSGMSQSDIQKHFADPFTQARLEHKAQEQFFNSNLSAASSVIATSPALQQLSTDVKGTIKAETHAGNAYWIARKREAQLKAQAVDERAKLDFYEKERQAYQLNGTPMSGAARRYFESNPDADGGTMYLAKHKSMLERNWMVRNADVSTAKSIMANKGKYGRRSAEVRWARDTLRRDRELRRGGGLMGRVFGGLPPWLIPVLAGVQLIGKFVSFINDTLNKIYKIIDGTTAKARAEQESQDSLMLNQSRVRWADSMKNAFGYNFTGAYTSTARGLSDIESHAAGTEGAIKAMALMGSSAGIQSTIEQALTDKDTVKATHAALAAFVSGTASGDTYLGKQSPAQAYLTNYAQLEKGFGSETAVLAGQLYTQYKSLSGDRKSAVDQYLNRGDLTGFIDALANSTGAAGIVSTANASGDLQEGLSEMSKMLKDQSEQWKSELDTIRQQTALTWTETTTSWKNFIQGLKKEAGHILTGTYGSVTEASSDAAKFQKNKENRAEAEQLMAQEQAVVKMLEGSGTLKEFEKEAEVKKIVGANYAKSGAREDAWGALFQLAARKKLSDQQLREVVSYMNARNTVEKARETIKQIDEANSKSENIKLVTSGDTATIKANAEMWTEQSGIDATKYTNLEALQDMLTGGGWGALGGLLLALGAAPFTAGASVLAAAPLAAAMGVAGANTGNVAGNQKASREQNIQAEALGLTPEQAQEYLSHQFKRTLEIGKLVSGGGTDWGEDASLLIQQAANEGYVATVQDIKVDVNAGKMYIEFDDPNSGRRRVLDRSLSANYYDNIGNKGASTGDYATAKRTADVLNQVRPANTVRKQ